MAKKSVCLLTIIISIIAVSLTGCNALIAPDWQNMNYIKNDDMSNIKQRLLESLYDDKADPSSIIDDIDIDGKFKSIDYNSDMKDYWHPIDHLKKALVMATALYSKGNLNYENELLRTKLNIVLQHWSDADYFCDWNGWWNGIGVGLILSDIILFPLDGLNEDTKAKLASKVYNASLFSEKRNRNIKEREIGSTGGNLTDKVLYSMKYAISQDNGSGMMFLKKLIENELRVFPNAKLGMNKSDLEGIKADMSFQQHFELLYLGGYGEVFCDGINTYLAMTVDTQFAINNKALNFYTDFILDGMQFAMRGEYRDINASGRGIVRADSLKGIYNQVITACNILLASNEDIARRAELQQLSENRKSENDKGAGRHKYFYNSDYQVYNGEKYMASVRHASKRTKRYEALNGENILGHYTGAGATFYYTDGSNYYNAMPTMNWNRVPGTTSRQGYLPKGNDNTYHTMGKTSFVGGVSNGRIGFSAMDYRDSGVKAKKSWFMFEDAVVLLGADIKSNHKNQIITNINQTLLKGDVVFSVDGVINKGKYVNYNGGMDWAYNNGIGYIISSEDVSLISENREGDYKNISERENSFVINNDMFELNINHGIKPDKATYAYTVLPNSTQQQTLEYFNSARYGILANNGKVQAVIDNNTGIIMATFYKKGNIVLPDGKKLEVNKSCVIMIDGDNIYMANPLQNNRTVTVKTGGEIRKFYFKKSLNAGATQLLRVL